MNFSNRLKELRKQKKLTQGQLAELVNVDFTTVGKWEQLGTMPNQPTLFKLCEIFECTVGYLLGRETKNPSIVFTDLFTVEKFTLPILGRIACGEPICDTEYEGYVKVGEDMKKKADYCLIAEGDSMNGDGIIADDVLLIRKQPQVNNGEIAAVGIGEDIALKHVYYNETGVTLVSSNMSYPPKSFTKEQIETEQVYIIGKYVGFIRMIKEK